MTKTKQLVIFGLTEFSELADYYFTNDSAYEVVGFCTDKAYRKVDRFLGKPVIAFEDLPANFSPDHCEVFLAIGYTRMNDLRKEKFYAARLMGYTMASFVSSRATVPVGFTARENTFIFEGNNIQPFVEIGENVIVWSCNHIGHHGSIENHCFLGSNISMAGSVRVGENCFIGGSACIDPQVHLGAYTLLGMQAHVSSDTAPYTTVSGPVSRTRKVNSMQVKLK